MDEILVPLGTTFPPFITLEEIREQLKPYYREKFPETSEERRRDGRLATIAWLERLLEIERLSGNEGLELIG